MSVEIDLLSESVIAGVLRTYERQFGPYSRLGRNSSEFTTRIDDVPAGSDGGPMNAVCVLATIQLINQERRKTGAPANRMSDWHIIHYALAGARTLHQALIRYTECVAAFDGRCGTMDFRLEGNDAVIRFDPLPHVSSPTGCIVTLCSLGQLNALLCWLIAESIPIKTVDLKHETETFEALGVSDLIVPVVTDAKHCAYKFDRALLAMPVVRNADELQDRPRNHPPLKLRSIADKGGIAIQVHDLVLRQLQETGCLPSLAEVARAYGTSVVTLRRHLSHEQACYREIRDRVRRELAEHFLIKSFLSIEDISNRLDFCNSNAFRDRFTSWYGISPTRFRREKHRATAVS